MNALVTGGGGFIGSALVRELINTGYKVTSFSRGDYPELREIGIKVLRGDLSDVGAVISACTGQDIVFHVAAKAGFTGAYKDYYAANVAGTENIIHSCRVNKVKYLIYTSSASVVFSGTGIEGADESLPYPVRPLSFYTATKALAEQLVLKENSASLRTLALRPHLVYGPGDKHLLPRIIDRAKSGSLRIIGKGRNIVDVTYIENMTSSQIVAAKAIIENPEASGKAYFITNGEPVLLWDFMNKILEVAGVDKIKKSVPAWIAEVLSVFIDASHKVIMKNREPLFTRFLVKELTQNHWFNICNARSILRYNPVISNIDSLNKMSENLS